MTARTGPLAALDVGSNTVRLILAKPDGNTLEKLLDLSAFVRLGKGVDSSGNLAPDRMDAAVETVRQFAAEAHRAGAVDVMAVATSAIRDAKNGAAFVDRVERETGVRVEIISGEREADLTFAGATLGLNLDSPAVVADLGGGSAEVIMAGPSGMQWAESLQIGGGRLTERFIRSDPPSGAELQAVAEYVERQLDTLPGGDATQAIFTGGTATRVPLLLGKEPAGMTLDPADFDAALDAVRREPRTALVSRYNIPEDRAAVMPAGVQALSTIAAHYGAQSITITLRGIREGMIVDRLRSEGLWPA